MGGDITAVLLINVSVSFVVVSSIVAVGFVNAITSFMREAARNIKDVPSLELLPPENAGEIRKRYAEAYEGEERILADILYNGLKVFKRIVVFSAFFGIVFPAITDQDGSFFGIATMQTVYSNLFTLVVVSSLLWIWFALSVMSLFGTPSSLAVDVKAGRLGWWGRIKRWVRFQSPPRYRRREGGATLTESDYQKGEVPEEGKGDG